MLIFDEVTKTYPNGVEALSNLSLHVREGETLVLLGPSGCGKTTALRLVNRLIDPTSGTISLSGKNIADQDPIQLRRHIGYAIQHIGLFLHMTVEENIGIVPKLLGWSEEKVRARVFELLEAVGLDPAEYLNVYPGKLSGGQKQRIGVARALAADPPVILMDEPFGALDPLMREQLQTLFLSIQSKIHKTVLFVTHDLSEAVKMGDRIAVIDGGTVLQVATPLELINNPSHSRIDQFLGKDRLQLLLQIQTLNRFRTLFKKKSDKIYPKVTANNSLMEALTTLKVSGAEGLAVYEENQLVGHLEREELMEGLIDTL